MSDKVRYYLENSIKEVEDLKKRGIFDKDEISKIIKRRTDYEHRLLARSVKPSDFLAYTTYEQQLDRLRHLRVRRLKKQHKLEGKGVSDWAGRRRIQFIYDRATRRFPAELGLWTAAVEYGRKTNSPHVVNRALTAMLRLHPKKPEVWVYVAKYQAEENSAIVEARAVLQRGLRFNPDSEYLWLEYMRLELIYVAKILARRKLLGLDVAQRAESSEQNAQSTELSALDVQAAETELSNLPDINIEVLGDVQSNPALRGDVALAVYDAAAPRFGPEFVVKSLQLIDEFTALDRQYLAEHVINHALTAYPAREDLIFRSIILPIRYVAVNSPEFPDAFRLVINLYGRQNRSLTVRQQLRDYLAELLQVDMDESLKKAVELFSARL